MLIDTHIHLDRFDPGCSIEAELNLARNAGIGLFLVPGVDRDGWNVVRDMVSAADDVVAAYGLHPQAADQWNEECRAELTAYLQEERCVAVGEIGLDRMIDIPLAQQEQVFREQLQLAVEASLPVLIHCRKRQGQVQQVLKEEQAGRVGGIMHAYGGSYETAKALIDLGFVLSFGGPLTYPDARRLAEVVRQLPDDAIVIETDAPDLTPHPHRGVANRPVWLNLVLQRVAEIRGWGLDEAATITSNNARRVLNLD